MSGELELKERKALTFARNLRRTMKLLQKKLNGTENGMAT